MSDATERWLPVAGWEDLYEVSDLGRVRSLDRLFEQVSRRWGTPMMRRLPGRVLKPCFNRDDRVHVNFSRAGVHHSMPIHRLVCEAFLGPRPDGTQILHGPGGQLDNRVANLSYGTASENNGRDKLRDGTLPQGTRHPNAKLTEAVVRECRLRYATSVVTYAVLASEFGVHQQTVRNAVIGKTWRHVNA